MYVHVHVVVMEPCVVVVACTGIARCTTFSWDFCFTFLPVFGCRRLAWHSWAAPWTKCSWCWQRGSSSPCIVPTTGLLSYTRKKWSHVPPPRPQSQEQKKTVVPTVGCGQGQGLEHSCLSCSPCLETLP